VRIIPGGNQIGDSGVEAIARGVKDSQLVQLFLGKSLLIGSQFGIVH
jgi:hypothetical protein